MTQYTKDKRLLQRFWIYVQPDSWRVTLALLVTPLTMVLMLVQPWLIKQIIDLHLVPKRWEGASFWLTAFLLAVLAAYLLETLHTLWLTQAGQNTLVRLRVAIYQNLLSRSPAFFDRRPTGVLLTRATSDIEALGEIITAGVISLILDILLMAGIVAIMFWMDWRLTLLLLAIMPPLAWLLSYLRKKLRECFVIIRDSLASLNGYLAERINGMDILRLFSHQEAAQAQFVEKNTVYRDATVRANFYDSLMFAIVDGMSAICIALMLWYATAPWFKGTLTIGLFVAFLDYLQRLFRPIQEFSGKISVIQRATTSLEKIFQLLDEKEGSRETEGLVAPKAPVSGHFEVSDLRFGYKDEDILKGVSFEVRPGEVLAIVGPTGCGKTTLTRLLVRTYEGYRGSILLDGQELRTIPVSAIREEIAEVRQDLHLFSETIGFNVHLDNPNIDQDDLEEAARFVRLTETLDALPGRWEFLLRERGANLSLGQGQLLTFARTVAYQPTVVILDEATASIDPKTEALIQDAIQRILAQKTVILIAHRLSTIQHADQILVMQAGQIIERGRHHELLALGGLYATLAKDALSASSDLAAN